MAPAVGFEPTTNRLTVDRSTAELRWNNGGINQHLPALLCNQKFTSDGEDGPVQESLLTTFFILLCEVSDFLLSDSLHFWFLAVFHG